MPDTEAVFDDKEVQKFLKKITNNSKAIDSRSNKYLALLSTSIFKDIIDHFQKEAGPNGKWSPWSVAYRNHLQKIGKGGNKILQDTGRLRNSFLPTNYKKSPEGIIWFNPAKTKTGFPYAAYHNETSKNPRPFMWISKQALDEISSKTLRFLEDGV